MNKEEIILEVGEADKEIDVLGDIAKRYAKRMDEYVFSQIIRQNKELQAKVAEAIEYLKYALDEEKETPSKYNDWRLDLLEILEGSDK